MDLKLTPLTHGFKKTQKHLKGAPGLRLTTNSLQNEKTRPVLHEFCEERVSEFVCLFSR